MENKSENISKHTLVKERFSTIFDFIEYISNIERKSTAKVTHYNFGMIEYEYHYNGKIYIYENEIMIAFYKRNIICSIVKKDNTDITYDDYRDIAMELVNQGLFEDIRKITTFIMIEKDISDKVLIDKKYQMMLNVYGRDLIDLQGSHFKNIRKCKNKLEANSDIKIVSGLCNKILNKENIKEITDLYKAWKASKVGKVSNHNEKILKVLTSAINTEREHFLSILHTVLIYYKDKLICYGIDQKRFGNHFSFFIGQIHPDYKNEFADLNKLINHYEAVGCMKAFNIPIESFTFDLGNWFLNTDKDTLGAFKNRLAPNTEIALGYISFKERHKKENKHNISIF